MNAIHGQECSEKLITITTGSIMTQIAPLSNSKHLNTHVIESQDYSRFAKDNLIPVTALEIPSLSTEFPIVFVKNNETEQFTPVALMGLKNGINLYCQTDKWQPTVTPLSFRNAPLSLIKTSKDSDELIVLINEASQLTSKSDGTRLFKDDGEQTDYLKARTEALLNAASHTQQTIAISKLLTDMELLVQQQLTIRLKGVEQPININGVYVVDDKAFNELSDEKILELKKKGLLQVIYAHRTSINQLARLMVMQGEFDLAQE